MTATQAITILGILIAAIVALTVGYLQRRQARQIELFRRDPSVGLIPPPTVATKFLKQWWLPLLGGVALPVIALADAVAEHGPVSQATVLVTSANVGVIVFEVMVLVNYYHSNRLLKIITLLAGATKEHLKLTEKLATMVTSAGDQSSRAGT